MFWAPGWLSLFSIRLLILAQVVTSGLWDPAPHQALHWAWSMLKILSHTATLENNMEGPQKVKSRPTLQCSNCTTRYLPRGYKYTDLKEHLHPNVYSSNVRNSQTMERAQVSTNKWMHKDVVRGACVAQSVRCLPSVQVMIPGSGAGMKPHIRLLAQQGVCFSLFLCPSPWSCSLFLFSQINR